MQLPNTTDWLRNGLLARKGESYEQWHQRCASLLEKIEKFKRSEHITTDEVLAPDSHLRQACNLLERFFGLNPDWACVIYTGKQMGWAHLGALVIATDGKQSIPFIQLHPRFLAKCEWLFYRRQEIIAHELIHLIRQELDDGSYEEFLAYDIDTSSYRRILGPIFSSPWSASLLVLSMGLSMFSAFILFWLETEIFAYEFIHWLIVSTLIIPTGFLIYSFYKFALYSWRWHRFKRKCRHFDTPNFARKLAIRLVSSDLEALSYLDPHLWKGYIQRMPAGPYRDSLQQMIH